MAHAELLIVPDAAMLKEEFKEVWCWRSNRNVSEAVRILESKYQDYEGIALPTAHTARHWVQRERWHEWADAELERQYPIRYRRLREGFFLLQEIIQQRQFEMFTGGRQMSKEESAQAIHLQKLVGAGTYGLEAGGEMTLQFDISEDDTTEMSLEQRARRVRDRMLEQNAGTG